MRQLSALDTQFLNVESHGTVAHIAGLAILDPTGTPGGHLTLDDLMELMRRRIPMIRQFRWRLAEVPLGLDHPYWIEDPDFDLEYHVREIALPRPGDDRQLADQVARLHQRPLDRARPPAPPCIPCARPAGCCGRSRTSTPSRWSGACPASAP